ncbi:hypothetical protein SESBI_08179 [Sesbania bispinosa]|nr:hypothetical protein SESBI_08179 [Sesbania bispinosa]
MFIMSYVVLVQKEAVTNQRVVGDGSVNSVTVRRGGCEKEGGECKEGNGGSEDTVLENEDYVYTNSLP